MANKRDTLTLESASSGCIGCLAGSVVGFAGLSGLVRFWEFVQNNSTSIWYAVFVATVLIWIVVSWLIAVFIYVDKMTIDFIAEEFLFKRSVFGWHCSTVEYAATDLRLANVREVEWGYEPSDYYLELEFQDGQKYEFSIFSNAEIDIETLQEWASR